MANKAKQVEHYLSMMLVYIYIIIYSKNLQNRDSLKNCFEIMTQRKYTVIRK